MQKSLKSLGIGTYRNIATSTQDTPIIVALNQFLEKRVSALPIINSSGWCINHSHYVYILRTFVTFFLGEVVDIYVQI